jgi:hypothetical protein
MPDSATRPLRVFLCHSSGDKPIVRELYQQLDAEGWIDAWLDVEKLYPGQDWTLEIEKAVEAADIILVCISNNSVTKEGYVQRELRMVLDLADYKPEGTLFIIPIRLEECDPPRRLRPWQYADYFPQNDRERAYRRLLVSLRNRAKSLGILMEKVQPQAAPNVTSSQEGFNSELDSQISKIIENREIKDDEKPARLVSVFFSDFDSKRVQWKSELHQEIDKLPLDDLVGQVELFRKYNDAEAQVEEQEFEKFKARVLRIGKMVDRSFLEEQLDDKRFRQGVARLAEKFAEAVQPRKKE